MEIAGFRKKIDIIDQKIIELIAERQTIATEIAHRKFQEGLAIHDETRKKEILASVFDSAVEHNIDPVFIQKIFEFLIEMSEERQKECSGEGNLP